MFVCFIPLRAIDTLYSYIARIYSDQNIGDIAEKEDTDKYVGRRMTAVKYWKKYLSLKESKKRKSARKITRPKTGYIFNVRKFSNARAVDRTGLKSAPAKIKIRETGF